MLFVVFHVHQVGEGTMMLAPSLDQLEAAAEVPLALFFFLRGSSPVMFVEHPLRRVLVPSTQLYKTADLDSLWV